MLVIPSPSLLNPLTLGRSPLNTIPSELFPASASSSSPPPRSPGGGCRRLTTTQLLTLHLALSRDPKGRHNSEWEVFIKSLPSFRPFHPVTWVIPNSDAPHDPWWEELEACLSESVRIKIAAVAKRYKEDLKILRRVLVSRQVAVAGFPLTPHSNARSHSSRKSSTILFQTKPSSGHG